MDLVFGGGRGFSQEESGKERLSLWENAFLPTG